MSMTMGAALLGAALLATPAAPAGATALTARSLASSDGHGTTLAFAPLWQPPEGTRRVRRRRVPTLTRDPGAPSGMSTEALEREVFGTSASASDATGSGARVSAGRGRQPMPSVRRRSQARDREDDDQAEAQGDDDEEEDGDGPGGFAGKNGGNLPPVIAPHFVTFALGTALMGRSFQFNGPLQPESNFPRGGLSAELESFPLLARDGWYARLGLGASFATESGNAGIGLSDGATLSYPATQRRWSFDVRYALPVGQRFLVVPLFGYGRSGYDLERRSQPAPSTCTASTTQVCIPDVQVSHLTIGVDARATLTPRLAVSVSAAFLPAFGLGRGAGQLGAESDASARGFSGAVAVSWQIMDWLALRAALPLIRYDYSFSGATRPLSYSSASETYYGAVLGATVFTR